MARAAVKAAMAARGRAGAGASAAGGLAGLAGGGHQQGLRDSTPWTPHTPGH